MKYLIDTQALAYYLYAGKQLPKTVKEFIDDYVNKGYVKEKYFILLPRPAGTPSTIEGELGPRRQGVPELKIISYESIGIHITRRMMTPIPHSCKP